MIDPFRLRHDEALLEPEIVGASLFLEFGLALLPGVFGGLFYTGVFLDIGSRNVEQPVGFVALASQKVALVDDEDRSLFLNGRHGGGQARDAAADDKHIDGFLERNLRRADNAFIA